MTALRQGDIGGSLPLEPHEGLAPVAVTSEWEVAHLVGDPLPRTIARVALPAVASSLIAFAIVYFAVFSAGVIYLLRMMASPPHHGEQGPSGDTPARAAGITPAAGVRVRGAAG